MLLKTPMSVLYFWVAYILFFEIIPEFYDVPWDISEQFKESRRASYQLARVDRHGNVLEPLQSYSTKQICQRFADDGNNYFWNRFEDEARQRKRVLRAQIELLTEQIKTTDPNAELRQHAGLNEAQAEIDEIDTDLQNPRTWKSRKCFVVFEE